ncbi:MAG: NAD(P)/FAD-dependent oxidoreductase [Clostridia bacterium]|nr:NAD(P)/FAD-dependent oxidoreductase [Clostridia bacterium]
MPGWETATFAPALFRFLRFAVEIEVAKMDVIIIGSGYGGLSTAALLARQNLRVLVLEQAGNIGGRASYRRRNGYIVEYGLHANRFGSEGAAQRLMHMLGESIDFCHPGPPVYFHRGRFYPFPNSAPKFLTTKILSFPERLQATNILLRLLMAKPESSWQRPYSQLIGKVRSGALKELMVALAGIGIVAIDPEKTSVGELSVFIRKSLKAKEKVAYPRGGTSQILNKLRQVIEKGGGEIRLHSQVKQISFSKDKAIAVELADGNRLQAQAIVCAFPVQNLSRIVPKNLFPKSLASRVTSLEPTAGIALDFGLKKPVSDIDGLVVTGKPVTMGQFSSNIDASVAPPGKQIGSWYYPLPESIMKNRERIEREIRTLRKILEQMFPGIWENLEWERILTLSMVDGFVPRPGQARPDRPPIRVPGFTNLFLAGDTTSAEGTGGDCAFNSAIECAEAVTSYLKSLGS